MTSEGTACIYFSASFPLMDGLEGREGACHVAESTGSQETCVGLECHQWESR